MIRHRHALDQFLVFHDLPAADLGCDFPGSGAGGLAGDAAFLVAVGVLDLDKKHEAIQLRLRQRVGALLLDGVLRGKHKEWFRQRHDAAGHGNVMLLHGLKQGGLRLGRGAVDFVGQNDVGEDRPLDELELAPALGGLLQNVGAGDVGRHQVGCELDAAEVERHHF